MKNVKLLVLLGLAVFGAIVFRFLSATSSHDVFVEQSVNEMLEGDNEILEIVIVDQTDVYPNSLSANVRYRYVGDKRRVALRMALLREDEVAPEEFYASSLIQRGAGQVKPSVNRLKDYTYHITKSVRIDMYDPDTNQILATKDHYHPVVWKRISKPQYASSIQEMNVRQLYVKAVDEINFGTVGSLAEAKKYIDAVVARDSSFAPIYVEVARYQMKTRGGEEGYRIAEQALKQGLSIDPNYANSYVLLGFVYTHQGRFNLAIGAFEKANNLGTDNPWLWVNWGEMLKMQGEYDAALKMFEKIIDRGRPYNRYYQARENAYMLALGIHVELGDMAEADRLFRERLSQYSENDCLNYRYAKFRQEHFDDLDTVLHHAMLAKNSNCRNSQEIAEFVGVAFYSKWANATDENEVKMSLVQAQTFFPVGPKLIFELASDAKSIPILEKLINSGFSVDVADNEGATALIYSVFRSREVDAVEQLLALGANPNVVMGESGQPLILLALMYQRIDVAELLINAGLDVEAQMSDGESIQEAIRRMGYGELLNMKDA
ncbi:hypothetical protein QWI17_03590 [Gilvimarinus sp. SDUM040013]|uniref:Tetratricopeptide repeat protein n=1 Tax=Gilvimarinus gilvus TaxID=3058038 RepID=A0ABU4S2B5_9GAMM|nr:ankyrin repeat domain-containing protein [Gilvimarinus sp. SDUM040013]MDO3384920.1 hypothetical protein [Gilvimarinus sp. SDUM040013]MDX6851295.1 hypothetical protein [Gilvimarinus sp. SDUM040013]